MTEKTVFYPDSVDVNDIPALASLEEKCFSLPHTKEQLERELNDSSVIMLCARQQKETGKDPVGYLSMRTVLDEGYIGNVAVDESYRRKGVAGILLSALITRARELGLAFITLEVRESNAPAIALYKKYGFQLAGLQKNYYTGPKENAIIMTLTF